MQADGNESQLHDTLLSKAQRLNPLLIIQAFVNHNECKYQKSICPLGGLSIYRDNCTLTICCQPVLLCIVWRVEITWGREPALVFRWFVDRAQRLRDSRWSFECFAYLLIKLWIKIDKLKSILQWKFKIVSLWIDETWSSSRCHE